MKIKKILCPVDFSDACNLAVKYAKELALLFNSTLHLLHVVEHLHGNEHYMILQITPQEIAEKMKKEAEEGLNSIVKKIKKSVKTSVNLWPKIERRNHENKEDFMPGGFF